VSGVLLGMGWFIVIYIAGWCILDKKPAQPTTTAKSKFQASQSKAQARESDDEQQVMHESIKVKAKIWQAGEPPKQAFYDIRQKFTVLEKKLRAMEHYVTSPEFTVSREINRL
jgi:phage shock protein C